MKKEDNFVIIITDQSDVSTELISKYLYVFDFKFKIVTPESNENLVQLLSSFEKSYSVYLRRGNFPLRQFIPELKSETKVIRDYLHYIFENKELSLGNLRAEYDHNKLIDLSLAQKSGLSIPYTTIITSRSQLDSLTEKFSDSKFITKSLKNALKINSFNEVYHAGYTVEVNNSDLDENLETLYPSIIQENIKKDIEIRSFYLKGNIYSMAIFSQANEETMLDYRNYNSDRPNRLVPYKLPKEIENSIQKFMDTKNLNCGSLDIILGKDGIYYFLEVNPVGQFGWLSHNCNYYLEERIAELLTQN